MKVLVATTTGQASAPGDYCWAVEGELVFVQLFDCSNPNCGCDRGFAGLSSSKATTTAMVRERPDLVVGDVKGALIAGLQRQGWLSVDWGADDAHAFAEYWRIIETVCALFDDGDVIERQGEEIRRRGTMAEFSG